jgi:hypothetical protein
MKVASLRIGYAALLVAAGLAVLPLPDPVSAQGGRSHKRAEPSSARHAGTPLLAVVALAEQRITIYGADGQLLQSPISTGSTGFETPAGVFSVVQKKEEHQSNLYQDGNMPFMQRITWTGIALHAGVLPGHPASHGCVRMPIAFAQRLFGMTDLGMRVVVVRDDIAPREIVHPALFKPGAARKDGALAETSSRHGAGGERTPAGQRGSAEAASARYLQALKAKAAALSAEAEAASRKARDARQNAARKAADAAPATRSVRAAEANLAKAERTLKDAESALAGASEPDKVTQAEAAKTRAAEKAAEAEAQLQAAKAQAQAKMDLAARAAEEAQAAEDARDAAAEAASEAERKQSPASVFVSRKAQRVYVRQANLPVYEAPITIRDADKPIGTFVFTALGGGGEGSDVRWSVVSMYKYGKNAEPVTQPAPAPRRRNEPRASDAVPADVDAARAALDRIAMPPEVVARVSEVVLPGASLIISDEAASIETGKDTDFVVVMAGEPQGALKARRREPLVMRRARRVLQWPMPSISPGPPPPPPPPPLYE